MAASTIIKVEAYANEHFREDFSRLPAVKVELVEFDYTKLRIEDKFDITVNHLKDLHYNPDQLRDLKPFCWVDISFEQYQKLEALLTYYVLVKYSDVARIRSPYFTDDFKLACADVAKGLRAAEAAKTAIDNPSNRGITVASQTQIQIVSGKHQLPPPSRWGIAIASQSQLHKASYIHYLISLF
jgi:hypothetical protein